MKDFYFYKPSGEIVERHSGPEDLMAWSRRDGLTLGVVDPGTLTEKSYVLDGRLAERPAMPVILDGMKLKGVSSTAKILIEGAEYDCTGADIDLEFEHPGAYTITVKDWPYLDWESQVEATT